MSMEVPRCVSAEVSNDAAPTTCIQPTAMSQGPRDKAPQEPSYMLTEVCSAHHMCVGKAQARERRCLSGPEVSRQCPSIKGQVCISVRAPYPIWTPWRTPSQRWVLSQLSVTLGATAQSTDQRDLCACVCHEGQASLGVRSFNRGKGPLL